MQLVVWQISGLGNQLFQYAAGRYYSELYGAPARLALAPAKTAFSHGLPRPFLLSHFNIQAPAAEASILDRLVVTQRQSLWPFSRAARAVFGVQIFREQLAQRYSFVEDLSIHQSTRTLYIAGYWQNHEIVNRVEQKLRRELSFKEPASGRNLESLKAIEDCRCPVSLHVRRGDYTSQAEGNIALPPSYYAKAIDAIRQRESNPTFFVFSDDSVFARANLRSDAPMVFVDHNDDYSSHEDLRLMSHCRHQIIANSTFSWWGAWLNPHAEKIVVAPRHWLLRKDSHFPQLTSDSWILLNVAEDPPVNSRYNHR